MSLNRGFWRLCHACAEDILGVTELCRGGPGKRCGKRRKWLIYMKFPSGDVVRYTYRWLRNNQVASEGEQDSLDTTGFLRDDVVAVAVIPHDKDIQGKEVMSQPVTLANRPPKFTSTAPASVAQGQFNYGVTAVDPENDPVAFLLEAAPPGMTIDERNGHIQWAVPSAATGSYHVKVVVKDSREGWASQEFDVSLIPSPSS